MNVTFEYDPKTKSLVVPPELSTIAPSVKLEIDQLNTLSGDLNRIDADVPPPATPNNFNTSLSMLTKKSYEAGVGAFKAGKFEDAIKHFTIGIEIINKRNKFESFHATLQELCLFLMSRADAGLSAKHYLDAYCDADMLLGMMMCTPDNFLRRGVANFFLGNYEEARADYLRGLAYDQNNKRLETELEICLDKILEQNGDYLE